MKTPAPAPTAPPRGIVAHPFDPDKGDRAVSRFEDALARANARAPLRGRQQVRRKFVFGRPLFFVQDVR